MRLRILVAAIIAVVAITVIVDHWPFACSVSAPLPPPSSPSLATKPPKRVKIAFDQSGNARLFGLSLANPVTRRGLFWGLNLLHVRLEFVPTSQAVANSHAEEVLGVTDDALRSGVIPEHRLDVGLISARLGALRATIAKKSAELRIALTAESEALKALTNTPLDSNTYSNVHTAYVDARQRRVEIARQLPVLKRYLQVEYVYLCAEGA